MTHIGKTQLAYNRADEFQRRAMTYGKRHVAKCKETGDTLWIFTFRNGNEINNVAYNATEGRWI